MLQRHFESYLTVSIEAARANRYIYGSVSFFCYSTLSTVKKYSKGRGELSGKRDDNHRCSFTVEPG